MGGMQMIFFTRYWVNDKQNLLRDNTKKTVLMAKEYTSEISDNVYRMDTTLRSYLNIMGSTIDAFVFISDNSGNIQMSSDNCPPVLKGVQLSDTIQEKLNGNEYTDVGFFDNTYSEQMYTVGEPIVLDSGLQIGYLFMSTPASGLSSYLMNNLQIFFVSSLGVLTLAFVALYLMTYRMVRPLRQMAAATRSFASGDFSYRVTVRGRDEVSELASSLNSMAVSLSSVEGMRRSFVANVSHELKTPMTTIAGFIDGILDGTIPAEKREHYLKIVSDEVKRLSRLVKSMLDLSRIDNGELHINPVRYDLTEQVCNVLLSFEQRIESKNIEVQGLEDCPHGEIYADFDLMGQVVYNLIDNAVKFTNSGGTLSMNIYKKDARVYCAIRNTGIGIPAQEMPHIFERFYKSDKSRSLDKNGMGLGLYIVKTVINNHKGEIVVRSTEGQYCEFEFWLPEYDASKHKPS